MGYNNFKIRKIHKEGFLSGNLVTMVEEKDMTVDTIRQLQESELGIALCISGHISNVLKKFVSNLPSI
jgi:hypothetical protein